MTLATDNVTTATDFVNLIFFKIFVNSQADNRPEISVYRNTRQQCRIRVAFIAVDANNRQVILTPSEIASAVRLIYYTGSTSIPHGSSFANHPEWYSSFTPQGFVWEMSEMAASQALQDDIDKVITEDLDIDHFTAFTDANKSNRIQSITSSSPDHHWGKEFFVEMVSESRRKANQGTNGEMPDDNAHLPDRRQGHTVTPNEHPLLGSIVVEDSAGRQDGAQEVTFLVSTRAASSLSIAATITSSTQRTFRTNHSNVTDPNGHGNGRGEFNSQVVVKTLPVPHYPISAFGEFLPLHDSDYVLKDHNVYWGSDHALRAFEHYIRLWPDQRRISLRGIVSPDEFNTSIWKHVGDVGAEWSYSYTGQPGQTKLEHAVTFIGFFTSGYNGSAYYTSITLLNKVAPNGIHRPRSGEIVIGQVMSDFHLQISDWNRVGSEKTSRDLVVRDERGNDHNLRLYLPNGYYKFNWIAIAKR